MEIFFFTICYFLIVFGGIFLVLKIHNFCPKIKQEKEKIDNLDKELYKELREIQIKSREIGKIAHSISETKEEKSPLTLRVEKLSKQISLLVVVVAIIIMI